MNKFLLLPLACSLLLSCNNEQQEAAPVATLTAAAGPTRAGARLTGQLDISSVAGLTKIGLASELRLSLLTVDGRRIDKVSALKPNTEYTVVVEGSKELQIRTCFGFDLLEGAGQMNQGKLSNRFSIKTHSDILESPMISLVPLRRVGTAVFREQAQMLSLIQ